MRILLTGASGFIARAFLEKHGNAHDITILGRTAPVGLACPFTLEAADLSDSSSTAAAIVRLGNKPNFDVIVHLAVSRLHRGFPESALDLFHVNVHSTALLMDFARRTGVAHVIVGSSGSVYDVPFGHAAMESDYLPPKSYFAATKQAADSLAVQYRPLFPVTVLRFFVPYGPGLTDRMLNGMIENIEEGRPIFVPVAHPPLTFSPIYIDDAVAVIARVLEERWNETVNVATGEAISLKDAGRLIAVKLRRELLVERSGTGPAPYLVPDVGLLRTKMSGHDFVAFEDGIDRLLAK